MTMIRLGCSGRLLSAPRLATYDHGPPWRRPHLSVSLLFLRDVLVHLRRIGIAVYRLPHQFAPYSGDERLMLFRGQLEQCADELAALRQEVQACSMRLTMHLPPYLSLSNPELRDQTVAMITAQAGLLGALGGEDPTLVLHIGAHTEDREEAIAASQELLALLGPEERSMLAIEHDAHTWSLGDAIGLARRCAVPVIYDTLHHLLYNPYGLSQQVALGAALDTWPPGRRPKIHASSPRLNVQVDPHPRTARVLLPRWQEHSDLLHPRDLLEAIIPARSYDIMIEAKAGDLAVLHLRKQLSRIAPREQGAVA